MSFPNLLTRIVVYICPYATEIKIKILTANERKEWALSLSTRYMFYFLIIKINYIDQFLVFKQCVCVYALFAHLHISFIIQFAQFNDQVI